jgi:general secretion pathway protein M
LNRIAGNQASGRLAGQLRERAGSIRLAVAAFWEARTEQERKLLKLGGAVVVLALIYGVLFAPAYDGRAHLRTELPVLRQEAAEIQALAREAQQLKGRSATQVPPMTRASLTASLTSRSLTAQSVSMTGEYAKLAFKEVQFAGLVTWLDAIRAENRIAVQDAIITPQATPGVVDATITLRQGGAAGAGGPQ